MIPPPQPPFGLILPPPDAPFAQGTPVPIEDLDKEEPPFDAMGEQTEVEAAATESPAESMPTLLPLLFTSSNNKCKSIQPRNCTTRASTLN